VSAHVVHWDDLEPGVRDAGHIAGELRFISDAAGSAGIGAKHWRVPTGKWSTPVHVHGAEEEIFYVLGGAGILWADGKAYRVGEGDCASLLPGMEAHSFRAGDDGLELLVFGERKSAEASLLPRAGLFWLGAKWVDAGDDRHPWEREVAAGEPDVPEPEPERPSWIVNLADVEEHERETETIGRRQRDLGRAAGSVAVGLKLYRASPGKLAVPPHCHSTEEELFVVLEGDGHVLLGDDELPLRRGSVVARPPATGVPHTFRGGADGLGYLAFGTRRTSDMCFYPRSGKVSFRGLGVIARVERLDYWDGEL
jgi:uncharacterized cupin superfamily protein